VDDSEDAIFEQWLKDRENPWVFRELDPDVEQRFTAYRFRRTEIELADLLVKLQATFPRDPGEFPHDPEPPVADRSG
jgi:hypothetical protein